jgi:hypothetical protein
VASALLFLAGCLAVSFFPFAGGLFVLTAGFFVAFIIGPSACLDDLRRVRAFTRKGASNALAHQIRDLYRYRYFHVRAGIQIDRLFDRLHRAGRVSRLKPDLVRAR